MNETIERNDEGIDSLRSRMDADARFRRALSGYDPQDVRAYVENVKRIFSQQTRAAKQEQEDLIAQLEAAKSEILARNCGIKKMKDILVERETQLNTANARINTLLQAVKKHVPEREELEYLRQQLADGGMNERIQSLESETQQLRATVTQASKLIETWKAERERILEENNQLRQEVQYLRDSAAKAAQQQDYNRMYAAPFAPPTPVEAPVRQPYADPYAAEARYAQQAPNVQQVEFSQTIDKLATMFAEAYRLVSQLKTNVAVQPVFQPEPQPQSQPQFQPQSQPQSQPQRTSQPFMQILRPEGTNAENLFTRK